MKIATGISFCIGKHNGRFRYYIGKLLKCSIRPRIGAGDNDQMQTGLRVDLVLGRIVRPIPKFWKREFWSRDRYIKNITTNPWNSGNHWFVIRIFPVPMLFVSASFLIGKYNPGGYIGGRTALVNNYTHYLANWAADGSVLNWQKNHSDENICAWGELSEDGNIYVQSTASLRLDMRH